MSPRLRTAAALAVLVVASPPTARAASSADVMAGLEGQFNLYGRDRAAYLIDVKARISEAGQRIGTGTVSVSIRRCVSICSKPVTYVGSLTSGQVQVGADLASGSLATALFGKSLSLQWSGAQSNPLPSYATDAANLHAGVYRVTGVKGLVAGSNCFSKQALLRRGVVYDPAPPGVPMPKVPPRALRGLLGGICQSGI